MGGRDSGADHVARLRDALAALDIDLLESWGRRLAHVLDTGGRVLAAGNGGSAAEAQHLTAELVGKLREDREPLSAIALHADTSSVTAIGNDYGFEEVFARQVRAHGRRGDVLLLLSASGRSENILRAAMAGRQAGLVVWGLTGTLPNPLAEFCDQVVAVPADNAATVQEGHLVAIHLLCEEVDLALSMSTNGQEGPADEQAPLVVIGDALLDQDLVGVVRRISPEAPVPVVDRVEIRPRPGGAGLAAVLAGRGSRPVVLVTALSSDRDGSELRRLLCEHGVRVIDLGSDGATPVKWRVRTADRSLMMLSRSSDTPAGLRRRLTESERDLVLRAAAILVSDYGCGVTHDESVRKVLMDAAASTPVVWDPHPCGAPPVKGVRLVSPSSVEAAHFTGLVGTGLVRDVERAEALLDRWPVAAVVISRGADGVVLVDSSCDSPLVVPGTSLTAPDTCGAGDAFAAAIAARLAEREFCSHAVTSAVAAAAEFVAEGGASAVVPLRATKIAQADNVVDVLARVRAVGGQVVATGGCFDLIHAGHIALLDQARRLGDCLVVCLNDDNSVRRLKGQDRPFVPERYRAAVLSSLGSVDVVVLFSEETPEEVLKTIRPDIYVKGGDYRIEDVAEASVITTWGGRTVIVPYIEGLSTTGMIARIKDAQSHPGRAEVVNGPQA